MDHSIIPRVLSRERSWTSGGLESISDGSTRLDRKPTLIGHYRAVDVRSCLLYSGHPVELIYMTPYFIY
jgi:hypothetical protein